MPPTHRSTPLVVVMALNSRAAEVAASRWRSEGAVVTVTRDWRACLRVATAIGPDVIVLDRQAPAILKQYLLAHPMSRQAHFTVLADEDRKTWSALPPMSSGARRTPTPAVTPR